MPQLTSVHVFKANGRLFRVMVPDHVLRPRVRVTESEPRRLLRELREARSGMARAIRAGARARGFTLIDLILIIIAIGIVAAFVFPRIVEGA